MTEENLTPEEGLAAIGLTLRTGQKLMACVSVKELNDENIKEYCLYNPIEYAFFKDGQSNRIVSDCVPYVLGYSTTVVYIKAKVVESKYQLDETTTDYYSRHAEALFKPLPEPEPEDKKDLKSKDNVVTLH